MNPGAETFTVVLQKTPNEPWGFRLQGGSDFTTPLSIQSVNPGSIAERNNIRPGDAVLQINGKATEIMKHDEAKTEIMLSGNSVTFMVQRGAVNIWRPQVTPLSELRPDQVQQMRASGDDFVQKTSLAASKQESLRIGSAHNRTARPFPGAFGAGGGSAPAPQMAAGSLHAGGQSQAMAGQRDAQAGGYYGGQQGDAYAAGASSYGQQAAFTAGGPGYGGGSAAPKPPGIRSVQAPVDKPPSERKPAMQMTCKVCGSLVTGVFVKICGEPYHPQCFTCAGCKKNLKNQGYFPIGDQLFCDNCASQQGVATTPVYR